MKLKTCILAIFIGLAMSGVIRLQTAFLHKIAGVCFLLAIGTLGYIYLEKEEEALQL